jgi:glycosyltransferase involved in cell wall biosynthesis
MSRTSPPRLLLLGKRHYTGKDAWAERFGRLWHLPAQWARAGVDTRLWLVDYHTRARVDAVVDGLQVDAAPLFGLRTLRLAWRALRWRPQVLVASGDAYLGLLGWVLARLAGARFVFDVYDKYDAFAGYRRPLGFDLFGFLRRRADVRLYASQALLDAYAAEGHAGVDVPVANGVDPAVFRTLPQADSQAALGLDPAARWVGYFGGMEADRGVADLVDAIDRLRADGNDVRLVVGGRRHPATDLDRPWIDYRGLVAHADMPRHLAACDVLAIPYRRTPFMDMGASCKIAEYLMCARPIVSTRTPNFTANFPEQAAALGAGLCEPADPADLARALAHQLRAAVVLSAPADLAWPAIATRALAAMLDSPPNQIAPGAA